MTMRCFATIAYVHKLNRILYIFVNVGKVIGFIALFHRAGKQIQCPSPVSCIAIFFAFLTENTDFKVEHHRIKLSPSLDIILFA